MTDKYWVGGAGTWNASNTANWSLTSGGASGAAVPTSSDNVFFNGSSGTPGNVGRNATGNTLDFNVSVSGWTFTGTGATNVAGNLNFSALVTWTNSGALTFTAATSKTITSTGTSFASALNFNSISTGTWVLQDNLTSTAGVTHTSGTIDLNGKTLTVGGSYTTATGTKNLTFNGGTLACQAATTTAFNNAQFTNYGTTAGTGTGYISMTAATAKTFVGGGSTFNCTLSQSGAGALTITGSNTFNDIRNTVQPATVTFTSGTTTTFATGFSLSGTAGNLVTIGSDTAATHTLSKSSGTVDVSYCTISYSVATGGATWLAYA